MELKAHIYDKIKYEVHDFIYSREALIKCITYIIEFHLQPVSVDNINFSHLLTAARNSYTTLMNMARLGV